MTSYDVVFFVVLLRRFIYMMMIQIDKTDSISRMIIYMLKNLSQRYFSYYIIKFISFILIYYDINLNIVSSFMVFSNLYIRYIDLPITSLNK